jgi:hypothetical protein
MAAGGLPSMIAACMHLSVQGFDVAKKALLEFLDKFKTEVDPADREVRVLTAAAAAGAGATANDDATSSSRSLLPVQVFWRKYEACQGILNGPTAILQHQAVAVNSQRHNIYPGMPAVRCG